MCSLLSKNSSSRNSTMCYRRLFKKSRQPYYQKVSPDVQSEFFLCFILLYLVPPSWTTLNTFPCKYFPSFEYHSTSINYFLMLLRLVEVLLTSDSSSTCQVLNCLEFTVFSSVCQSACIVAPRIVLFQCGTTISLGYDMVNISLHNI